MNKIIATLSALVFGLLSLTGCSQNAPVEVKITENPINAMTGFTHSLIVNVLSKTDLVTVQSIKINRGNCHVSGSSSQLKFGEVAKFYTGNCEIQEIEVDTDSGDFTFTF